VEKDNEDQKLIKPEWIRGTEMLVEEENVRGHLGMCLVSSEGLFY